MVFTVPQAVGGAQPVAVTCTSQPGAGFPVGQTTVTCTATDSLSRTASCSFSVTIRETPRISKTSFMAFGDSITNGVKSDPIAAGDLQFWVRPFSLGDSHSYPYKLNTLLTTRYAVQTLTVVNRGVGGEVASDILSPSDRIAGEERFRTEMQTYRPEIVLLMEGTNDLYFGDDAALRYGIAALDRMISEAQSHGARVFLATIPPQRSGRSQDRTRVAPQIPGFNNEVRSLAARRGLTVVDIYSAINTNLNLYIGDDDLHPTEAGFAKIAETFYDALRANLEVSQGTTAARSKR